MILDDTFTHGPDHQADEVADDERSERTQDRGAGFISGGHAREDGNDETGESEKGADGSCGDPA